MGKLRLEASGELRVIDGKPEEVRAALSLLAGEKFELRNNVVVGFTKTGRFKEAKFRSDLLLLLKNTRVELDDELNVDSAGATTGRIRAALKPVQSVAADIVSWQPLVHQAGHMGRSQRR